MEFIIVGVALVIIFYALLIVFMMGASRARRVEKTRLNAEQILQRLER